MQLKKYSSVLGLFGVAKFYDETDGKRKLDKNDKLVVVSGAQVYDDNVKFEIRDSYHKLVIAIIGKVRDGQLINGSLFSQGTLKKGSFIAWKLEGEGIEEDENGKLLKQGKFENGALKDGVWFYEKKYYFGEFCGDSKPIFKQYGAVYKDLAKTELIEKGRYDENDLIDGIQQQYIKWDNNFGSKISKHRNISVYGFLFRKPFYWVPIGHNFHDIYIKDIIVATYDANQQTVVNEKKYDGINLTQFEMMSMYLSDDRRIAFITEGDYIEFSDLKRSFKAGKVPILWSNQSYYFYLKDKYEVNNELKQPSAPLQKINESEGINESVLIQETEGEVDM